ncbi:MAG: InlB B-repeat-containing protein [Clostridia bacterium]|nr:InlB B-repeat-containing protein [Clostridia bacterium]
MSGVENGTLLNADTTLTAVNNDGYTFVGWYDSDGNKVSSGNDLTYTFQITLADMENYITNGTTVNYIAKWTYYTLTVAVDESNGGYAGYAMVSFDLNYSGSVSTIPAQKINSETGLVYPEIPTRSGYVFKGWYSDADCTGLFDFSSAVAEDITLYAGWHYKNYTGSEIDVTENYNSSSSAYTVSPNSSYSYVYFRVPTAGSYSFYCRTSSTSTYYRVNYTVYNETRGTSITSSSTTNTTYSLSSFSANAGDVIRIGYQRYYSNYSPTFSFYVNGVTKAADGGLFDPVVQVSAGTTHTLRAEAKDGYTFLGWYKQSDDTLISTEAVYDYTMTAEDVILVAKYAQA